MADGDDTGLVRAKRRPSAAQRQALSELPRGYEWRPLTARDVPAIFELESIGEVFDDGAVEVELADLEGDWLRPGFDPAVMSVGVFQGGRLVAYAQVFLGRAEALVHPAHRGKGIGRSLAHWTWEAARADGGCQVGQTISDNEASARALFESLGYRATHTAWILRTDLAARLHDAGSSPDAAGPGAWPAALPPGYRFRPLLPGVDEREVFAVVDSAFDEWRGSGNESMGFEDWAASTLHKLDPGLVVIIERQGRIVGVAVGRDHGPEADAWVEQVAVERAHRGQGLGRALLQECFRRLGALGRTRCAISTDSRTGALSLYEHLGMSVDRSYTRWTKTGL